MNAPVRVAETMLLPALIDRAAKALAGARTSAEVLEARDLAGVAYDAAKKAARLASAKKAHDEVVAAAHRAQADALEIEAGAKRRIADEYDAAQERGEVRGHGNQSDIPNENITRHLSLESRLRVRDLQITSKAIHEAREIRDAEVAEPGIVRRALDNIIEARQEPTRAKVMREVKTKSARKRRQNFNSPTETQHDRDLRALLGMWESVCESAQQEFLKVIGR